MIPKVTRTDVKRFLETIRAIFTDKSFNIDDDFVLIKASKEDIEHSTKYTLLDLDYDAYDVVEVIKKLEIDDFSEIKMDEDDPNPPLLYVFGKIINGKEIYIKIKCRNDDDNKQVICVSFHYSIWKMNYMFRK